MVQTYDVVSSEEDLRTFHPSTIRWLFGTTSGWITILACLMFVGIPVLALVWLSNICTTYTITTQRVKIRNGIIFRTIDEVELYRIKDVKVDYSLLNQLFDIGIVSIYSSDATTKGGVMQLSYIVDARNVREVLRNLVEKSRRMRGVREIDVDRVL